MKGWKMIPVWTESTACKKEFPNIKEKCFFCENPTDTWHENTNQPVCVDCAKTKKVSDITEDHGQVIRRKKREGTFDREDSVRAN
jgi:hypothetical protein